MSFSPEEESFAAEFLRKIQYGKSTVSHDTRQLEHVETQIGRVQAGLTGEMSPASIEYQVKNFPFPDRRYYRLDKQFLQGMITTARYLRRNVR